MKPSFSSRITLSIVVFLNFLSVTACSTPSPFDVDMEQARVLVQHGEYTAAEGLYRSLLDLYEDPNPALALADLYTEWNRPILGLSALETAVERGINHAEIITRELTLLQQNMNWSQVIDSAQMVLDSNPGSPAALQALTTAYLQLYRCADARVISARAWQANKVEKTTALTYSILNEDAAVLCSTVPELCSVATGCEVFCYADTGEELIRMNQWSLASCILSQAADLEPENSVIIHAWLGESLARIGRAQEAENHFHTAVEQDPANPLGWLLLGSHALKQGDWETARAALLNAQRLDPDNPAPCLVMAELKAAQGLYSEVDTWVKAALERATNDIDVWKAGARIYISRNLVQAELPVRIADSALHLDPKDAEAHLLLGWAYLLRGDAEQALPELDQAVELDASLGQAHYLRGVLLAQRGDTEEADGAFIRAADLGYFP